MTYTATVIIVETPIFTRLIGKMLADEEYRRLQITLLLRPEQGALIPGAHGLRKIRWKKRDRGKRGGLRFIYFWDPPNERLYMIYGYEKSQQADLTPSQIKTLGRIVREELK